MSTDATATAALGARARAGAGGAFEQSVLANPGFQELVRSRNGLATTLALLMLVIYLGFIGLVAFDKPLLASKVGGGTISIGIVLGLVVIVLAFLLTAIYVVRANGHFDDLTDALKRELNR